MSAALLTAVILLAAPECAEPLAAPPVMKQRTYGGIELLAIERPRPMITHLSLGFRGKESDGRALLEAAGRTIASELNRRLGERASAAGASFTASAGVHSVRIDGQVPADGVVAAFEVLAAVLETKPAAASGPRAGAGAIVPGRPGSAEESALAERAIVRLLGEYRPVVTEASVERWLAAHGGAFTVALLGPAGEPELERIGQVLARLGGSRAAAAIASPAPAAVPAARRSRRVLVDVPGKQQASLLFVRRTDAALERAPLEALLHAVAGSAAGKLPGLIEPPSGPAREVYTAFGPSRFADAVILGVETPATDAAQAITDVLDALAELRREAWSTEDAAVARSGAIQRRWLELSSPARTGAAVVDARLAGLSAEDPWQHVKALSSVDHLALRRSAEALLAPEGWQVLVLAEASPALIGALTRLDRAETVEVWAYDDLAELVR